MREGKEIQPRDTAEGAFVIERLKVVKELIRAASIGERPSAVKQGSRWHDQLPFADLQHSGF